MDTFKEIIVFATAAVGLLGALVEIVKRFNEGPGNPSAAESIIDIIRFVALLAFVPGMFLFFMFLERMNVSNQSLKASATNSGTESLLRATPAEADELVYGLEVIDMIRDSGRRAQILDQLVTEALRRGAPDLAIAAASEMPLGTVRDMALQRIVNTGVARGDYHTAVRAADLLGLSHRSDMASRILGRLLPASTPTP